MGTKDWSPAARLLAIAAVALMPAAVVGHHAVDVDSGSESPEAVVTATGCDAEQQAMLDWAVAQVSRLPGGLPDIDVRFLSEGACDGCAGTYVEDVHQLSFCNEGSGWVLPRQTMVHELVHAWSFQNMTDDQIEAFLELRGLETWTPDGVAWWQSGQEQVAEIVAWGLKGDLPYWSPWTCWEPCDELAEAFILLAGFPPDGPYDACRP